MQAGGDSGSSRRPAAPSRSWIVRLAHALNLLCLVVLFMSGLQIFNAHPALYWGEASDLDAPLAAIEATWTETGDQVATATLFGHAVETTGLLGWTWRKGELDPAAFPAWLTIPNRQDLATGRVWHFAFAWLLVANGLAYLLHLLVRRRWARDFRAPGAYGPAQRAAYLAVVFLALPAMVATGLCTSPAILVIAPWLADLFGGRQSARTLHFLLAWSLAAFALVHGFLALRSPGRLGAMIFGRGGGAR